MSRAKDQLKQNRLSENLVEDVLLRTTYYWSFYLRALVIVPQFRALRRKLHRVGRVDTVMAQSVRASVSINDQHFPVERPR